MSARRHSFLSIVLAAWVSHAIAADPPKDPPKAVVSDNAKEINFDSPNRIPGQFIVVFKREVEARQALARSKIRDRIVLPHLVPTAREDGQAIAEAMARQANGKLLGVWHRRFGTGTIGFAVQMSDEEARKLAEDPRVESVGPNVNIKVNSTQSLPSSNTIWHLDRIDQDDLPLNQEYRYDGSVTGLPIRVYVIDTGTRTTHKDFTDIAEFVVNCSATGSSWRCAQQGQPGVPEPLLIAEGVFGQDCEGHGTMVSGLIGGQTRGVARDAFIKPIKYTSGCTDGGTGDVMMNSIAYVLWDMVGPRTVVNMSFGFRPSQTNPAFTAAFESAVQDLIDGGATVVTAAGQNEPGVGAEDACLLSPARMAASSSVITVGASTKTDQKWSDSHFGSCVSLFAPGVEVTSASNESDTAFPSGSGTSFAAPIVSGLAALYKDLHPNDSPAQVKAAIVDNATAGTLTNVGSGSPNKLACSLCLPGINPAVGGGGGGGGGEEELPTKKQKGMANAIFAYVVRM